ncbi:MAG: hypothetical protein JNJ76_06845 [Candidatus Competibacter sp.]|nr:hypothetical protein [Candidatus Competibacter sp.]
MILNPAGDVDRTVALGVLWPTQRVLGRLAAPGSGQRAFDLRMNQSRFPKILDIAGYPRPLIPDY